MYIDDKQCTVFVFNFFVLLPTSYIAGSGIVDQSQCSSLIAIFLKLHVYRKNWMTEHI